MEHDVETVIINLLSANAGLAGITIAHHTRRADVEADQITVRAVRNEELLPGPGGFEYEVEISAGMGIKRDGAATTLDDVMRIIDLEMTTPGSDGDAGEFFRYFEIREDQESDKEARGKEIRRAAMYMIHAAAL